MKIVRSLLSVGLLFFAVISMTSCGHSHGEGGDHSHGEETTETSDTAEEAADNTGKEYTSAYICPMHCEGSGSHEAGECPVCGMAYVANEDYKEGGEGTHDEGNEELHDETEHKEGDGHDHN